MADSFFTPLHIKRRVTYLAKSEYFTEKGVKGRLKKWFFSGMGQVPIDRGGASAAHDALMTGVRLLNEGKLLGIYPEGTRSPDGRLYKGKTGVARMALEAGVPVIPVVMIGTDKVNPIGSKMWRPHRITAGDRPAAGLLPLRGDGRRPVRRAVDDRRDHVPDHGAVRPGVRRRLRRQGQGGRRATRGARGTRSWRAAGPARSPGCPSTKAS